MNEKFLIGDTITAQHRGQQITGRIVGTEASEHLRGWPASGTVLTVDVGGGEWVQVRDSQIVRQAESATT